MKYLSLLTFMALCLSFSLSSCGNSESDRIRNEAREALPQTNPNATVTPPPPTTPTVNNSEPHYKCPNNCAGGVGAAQGTCPVCGTALAHNAAYHDQPATTNPAITTSPQTPQTPAEPRPAQNAAGVYHYTCSNGCSGGSGSAGNCASCGNPLAHNPAYHN